MYGHNGLQGMVHVGFGVRQVGAGGAVWLTLDERDPWVASVRCAAVFSERCNAAGVVFQHQIRGVRAQVVEFFEWRGIRLYRSLLPAGAGAARSYRTAAAPVPK